MKEIAVTNIIQKIMDEVKEACIDIDQIDVKDTITLKHAADGITLLKKLAVKLKKEKTECMRPYKDQIKAYEGKINAITTLCDMSLEGIVPKYQDYVQKVEAMERKRLEEKRIAEIKVAQEEARVANEHIQRIEKETGVDLAEQKEDVAQRAIAEIQKQAEAKINVNIKTHSNIGTVSTRKNYRAEVLNAVTFLQWIIAAHAAGVDRTGMIDFKQIELNRLSQEPRYKKLIDEAPYNEVIKNGLRLYLDKSLNVR